ncbi:MAG TPA: YncE family protein [Terracidiphilus sp.]|jgi:YVTN family beta-propeller protein
MNSPNATIARLSLLALLAFTGCRSHDFPQYPPNYREYAYVTNSGGNTVTVLDVVDVRVDREIVVGQKPVAVAVSPTRNEVYVVNSGAADGQGSVSIINAENNTVTGAIYVHNLPVSIEIDSTGDLAYVANSGSNTISVLDLKARREIAVIGTGEEPAAARLSPDNKTLVVANRRGNSVSIFDPARRRVRAIFEGCPGASDAVVLPDSSKVFVPCSAGHQIMAIALAHPEVHPAQPGGAPAVPARPDSMEALLDVGKAPLQLALKPDGGEVFSLNSLSDSISEIITSSDDVNSSTTIGDTPVRGLVSADNSLLYVANFRSQYVTVYSIDDGRLAGSIHVGDGSSAMAFSGSGLLLFVVDSRSGDVAVARTASHSFFTLLPAGRTPNAIALKAFRLP